MDKQFLAQELNAPITKNHRDGLSNRPAQPIVTSPWTNETRWLITERLSWDQRLKNPTTQKSWFIRSLREMIFQSVTRAAQKKKIRVLSIEDEPMTVWLLVRMLFHSKLKKTGGI